MAAGRAPLWFLVATPGVVVIALGLWNLLPASDATETRANAPAQSAASAPPAVVVAPTESEVGNGCVAPPCDDLVSGSTFSSWRPGDAVGDTAITGRVVDSNGMPVAPRVVLRFWTAQASWSTWMRQDGRFSFVAAAPGTEYDVDAILPRDQFPGRSDGRFHVAELRAGDRDVVLRLPVARTILATGTLVDTDGRSLAGWQVAARRQDRPADAFPETLTDRDGRFQLVNWTTPEFRLELRTPQGAPRRIASLDVTSGSPDVRLTAGPPILTGIVVVEDGASAARAVVRLRDAVGGTDRSVTVGIDGVFSFDDVDEHVWYAVRAALIGHVCRESAYAMASRADNRVVLTEVGQFIEGTALGRDGRPLRFAWLRFIATDPVRTFQTMTDVDGAFFSIGAWPADFGVFLLVPGPDGRLVPGPKLGRCRGGDRNLQLRASR